MAKKKRKKDQVLPAVLSAGAFGVGSYFFMRWAKSLPRDHALMAFGGAGVGVVVLGAISWDWLKAHRGVDYGGAAGIAGGLLLEAVTTPPPSRSTRLLSTAATQPSTPTVTRVMSSPEDRSGDAQGLVPARWGNTPEDQALRANPSTALVEAAREEDLTPAQRRMYDRAWALLAQFTSQNAARSSTPAFQWYGDLRVDLPALQQQASLSPPDRSGRLDNRTMNAIREEFASFVQRGYIR